MKSIYLVGLSGSGKSTLGRRIAERTGREFVDTDELIAERTGRSVASLFAGYGEDFFREMENRALREVGGRENMLVATGGGVVKNSENIVFMREKGLVVFLDRRLKSILRDIVFFGRPLLADGREALYGLAAERRALYLAAAHIIYKNNGGELSDTERLLALIQEKEHEI